MDTEVPGGQQVFATPSGQFGYTEAHSATLPPGAVTTGFQFTSGSPGSLNFGEGFIACPTGDGVSYQVLVFTGTPPSDACIGIAIATFPFSGGVAAWQYT